MVWNKYLYILTSTNNYMQIRKGIEQYQGTKKYRAIFTPYLLMYHIICLLSNQRSSP